MVWSIIEKGNKGTCKQYTDESVLEMLLDAVALACDSGAADRATILVDGWIYARFDSFGNVYIKGKDE